MQWNWQHPNWPNFSWRSSRLAKAEQRFLMGRGVLVGSIRHLDLADLERLTVESMCDEAITTSRIEGEILDRRSVQSSIRRALGLSVDTRRTATPAEEGIAEMMVDLVRRFDQPLREATLFDWHRMIMRGRDDVRQIGRYRAHAEPMQIVSGRVDAPKVHFEAPPSSRVATEMARFLGWFEQTSPGGATPLPALARAGIAHLHFESIHPFEDGNGRIGRAISEKAIAQSVGQPVVTALATTILARRRSYYEALEAASTRIEVTEWLAWFAAVCLEAQERTLALVEFVLHKASLLARLRGSLNARQEAALLRMLREGADGFEGGLSAGKYIAITKASPATATRDLAELVEMGALVRVGERRHTRYLLPVPHRYIPRFVIDDAGEVIEQPQGR